MQSKFFSKLVTGKGINVKQGVGRLDEGTEIMYRNHCMLSNIKRRRLAACTLCNRSIPSRN